MISLNPWNIKTFPEWATLNHDSAARTVDPTRQRGIKSEGLTTLFIGKKLIDDEYWDGSNRRWTGG